MNTNWCLSDPSWWINTIADACSADLDAPKAHEAPTEYFADIKRRWECTLRYIGGTHSLNPGDVRRALFFAKALKKWRLEVPGFCSAKERAQRACEGFVMRNLAAGDPAFVPHLAVEMRRLLAYWLPEIGTADIHGRFGPGSVAERMHHPQRFCRLHEWCASGGAQFESLPTGHGDVDAHVARLCAVPKDYDKDRLITVEPVYASFVQQRVRRIILESIHAGPLAGTAMDLGYTDGQAIQRRLALAGSRTKRTATLDLSDASDRISWAAVQTVFPQWLLDYLWQARTSHFESPVSGPQRLDIYAGMGNATTFAVETLFFSAYVVAFASTRGLRPWVSTFGDDIITTCDIASAMIEEGSHPFFVINAAKSFWGDNSIRESCGVFAYDGADVTVPKIDGYPDNFGGALAAADLHRRLSASHDIFQVVLASRIAATGLLPNWPYHVHRYPSIVDWTADWSALPKTRQNARYQYREARVHVPCASSVGYVADDAEAVRRNTPSADVWYQARLLECVGLDPNPKGSGASVARFPQGTVRWRTVWARTEVESSDSNLSDASPQGDSMGWVKAVAGAPRPGSHVSEFTGPVPGYSHQVYPASPLS